MRKRRIEQLESPTRSEYFLSLRVQHTPDWKMGLHIELCKLHQTPDTCHMGYIVYLKSVSAVYNVESHLGAHLLLDASGPKASRHKLRSHAEPAGSFVSPYDLA